MPDFGIMRGFNEKLFGDKLVAGQLPTQLGLIGSTDFGFDADAQAFFDRVTAATGTLSNTEKLAVDTLVRQMKLDGIWSLMKAIYPMVGASAAACAQNLKSSSFTGSFTITGWTFASSGITPDGISAFMNTGLNPINEYGAIDSHLSFYSRTNNNTGFDMGGELPLFQLIVRLGDTFYSRLSNDATTTNTNGTGFYIGSSNSSIGHRGYKNGLVISSAPYNNSLYNGNLFIGSANISSGVRRGTKQCAFASIGNALTADNVSNFNTAVQAFQTTLSRNV
jgi:hypothetical protein